MLKVKGVFIILLMMMFATGCVSSKEYKIKFDEAETLRDQVGALEGELAAERSLHQEDVARLSGELDTMKNKNETLTAANTELESKMEADRTELIREIAALKQELTSARLQNDALSEENANLQAELQILNVEKQRAVEARKQEVSELQSTYNELVGELKEEIDKGRVAVSQLKDKLTLSMVDKILFNSGQAEVNKEGRAVLDRVAEILKKVQDKQVRIEGHTDNVAIGAALAERFPTNWELSTARATNVVRYLQDNGGLEPERLSAAGYSEYRPVESNETPEGKARNRRIEIVLVPLDVPMDQPEEEIPGIQ